MEGTNRRTPAREFLSNHEELLAETRRDYEELYYAYVGARSAFERARMSGNGENKIGRTLEAQQEKAIENLLFSVIVDHEGSKITDIFDYLEHAFEIPRDALIRQKINFSKYDRTIDVTSDNRVYLTEKGRSES